MPRLFAAAPTRAESARVRGRLDPAHPGTARVLAERVPAEYEAVLSRVDPAKVLIPLDADRSAAGEVAGRAARLLAGGGRKSATAFDRVEWVSDAPTAVLARRAGSAVLIEDRDFEALARLTPGPRVLLYDKRSRTRGGS